MGFSFSLKKKDKKTNARLGLLMTPHGVIHTPAFSVVATRATVRGLDPNDLRDSCTQAVLGNAYHLYLHPGLKTLQKFGGFPKMMGWSGPTITDSGGYQVSFLWHKANKNVFNKSDNFSGEVWAINPIITDEGMYFRSHIDGSKHLLTPEKSMQIQKSLGADIIMALDQPMGYKFTDRENKKAWERTFKWEERSFAAWKNNEEKRKKGTYQALFGIIQGQTDRKKRKKFLDFILGLGFPGIAIGDETIGANPEITARSLDTIKNLLPDNKPLHALGLGGGPEGIFTAVSRGVDIFDNSGITRMARTGLLFIHPEDGGKRENKFRIDIKKNIYHSDKKPISKFCGCPVCRNFSRAYIHHLQVSSEILGLRLATIHNLYFINDLMDKIRTALNDSDFTSLKKHWLSRVRT